MGKPWREHLRKKRPWGRQVIDEYRADGERCQEYHYPVGYCQRYKDHGKLKNLSGKGCVFGGLGYPFSPDRAPELYCEFRSRNSDFGCSRPMPCIPHAVHGPAIESCRQGNAGECCRNASGSCICPNPEDIPQFQFCQPSRRCTFRWASEMGFCNLRLNGTECPEHGERGETDLTSAGHRLMYAGLRDERWVHLALSPAPSQTGRTDSNGKVWSDADIARAKVAT